MKKMNKKGFTLIEMLVVIAIIAVLVAIIVPTVSSATEKSKAAADAANLRTFTASCAIERMEAVPDYTTLNASAPKSKLDSTMKLVVYENNDVLTGYFIAKDGDKVGWGVTELSTVADGSAKWADVSAVSIPGTKVN